MISSFARPTPTTCGSREEPPRSGTRPSRVSGRPATASSENTRRSQASASSSAPPRQAPCTWQTTGLVMVSARFHASSAACRKARRFPGAVAAPARVATSMPAEKTLPAPRRTTQWTAASCAAARSAAPMASTSSSLSALRFSGRLRMRWRTGPRSSAITRSGTAAEPIAWGGMNWAGVRELLRPPPHRGPLIAAGAVPLALGIALAELRLEWSPGARAIPLLGFGALLYGLGAQAPNEDGRPPAYQSVLLVTGLLLLYAGLLGLAAALGADPQPTPSGALVWTSAVGVALALWPALERNSALCLLLAAILLGVGVLSAWNWIFHPGSPTPYR